MARVIPITFDDVDRAMAAGECPHDCPYLHCWQEHHGEGMYEPMSECTLSADRGDPEDCLIVERFLDQEDADDDQEEAPCASPS